MRDLLDCIAIAWANVPGGLRTLTLDGESGTKGKGVDDWAMYNHMFVCHTAFDQKAVLLERQDAFVRSALQRR